MEDFGRRDPRQMPRHLFQGSLRLNYDTAVRANVDRQNCSICPRYWYVDAVFRCARCGTEFSFSATEQRTWYEEYEFWIDAIPKHCLNYRRTLRELKVIRQEYDRTVADVLRTGDLEGMQRLATVIDQLYEMGGKLPPRINETRRRLANEISRTGGDAT